MGPVRKKSILHNSGQDISEYIYPPGYGTYINQITFPLESFRSQIYWEISITEPKQNGNKRHSQTDSIYSKGSNNKKDDNHIETSWIYALCMRCREQYNTPSYEPRYWQKVCPAPLCPSFRQVARLFSIILIGM